MAQSDDGTNRKLFETGKPESENVTLDPQTSATSSEALAIISMVDELIMDVLFIDQVSKTISFESLDLSDDVDVSRFAQSLKESFIEQISEALTWLDMSKSLQKTEAEAVLNEAIQSNEFCELIVKFAKLILSSDKINQIPNIHEWSGKLIANLEPTDFVAKATKAWKSKKKIASFLSEVDEGNINKIWTSPMQFKGNISTKNLTSPMQVRMKDLDWSYLALIYAKSVLSSNLVQTQIKSIYQPHHIQSSSDLSAFLREVAKLVQIEKEKETEPHERAPDLSILQTMLRKIPLLNFFASSGEFSEEEDAQVKAGKENALQIKKLLEKKTVWHAVSSLDQDDEQKSWKIVKQMVAMVHELGLPPPGWQTGEDRGVFGETPLHIAVLWNSPSPKLDSFFFELWDMCPDLHDAVYRHPLYEGENALHIAIVKRAGLGIIGHMAGSAAWPRLLEHRAVGTFFKRVEQSDGACTVLGEHPLSFAACTNQRDTFEYLRTTSWSAARPSTRGRGRATTCCT